MLEERLFPDFGKCDHLLGLGLHPFDLIYGCYLSFFFYLSRFRVAGRVKSGKG